MCSWKVETSAIYFERTQSLVTTRSLISADGVNVNISKSATLALIRRLELDI